MFNILFSLTDTVGVTGVETVTETLETVSDAIETVTPTMGWNLYTWLVNVTGANDVVAGILGVVSVLLCIIVPYLLGSINPAIIFSKTIYNDDIRDHGSGNAGTTNTLRTYGKRMAALIFCVDLLKAAVAVIFGCLLMSRNIGGAIAGLFVVLGHMFPIYYKFRGGKGVASTAMVVLILSPFAFIILLPIFALIVLMTKYVSLASIMSVMLLPLVHQAFNRSGSGLLPFAFVCIMVLIIFMHRENIKRIMAGTESKTVLFKRKKKKDDAQEKSVEQKAAESVMPNENEDENDKD